MLFLRRCNLSDEEKRSIYEDVLNLIQVWNDGVKELQKEKQINNIDYFLTVQDQELTAFVFYIIHDMILSGKTLDEIITDLKNLQEEHLTSNPDYSLVFTLAIFKVYHKSEKAGDLYKIYFKVKKRKKTVFDDCLICALNDCLVKLKYAGILNQHYEIKRRDQEEGR